MSEDKAKAEVLKHAILKSIHQRRHGNFSNVLQLELPKYYTIEGESARKLCSLRVDESLGPDQIHPRIHKEFVEVLAILLHILLKSSLGRGEVLNQSKTPTLTPILKNLITDQSH